MTLQSIAAPGAKDLDAADVDAVGELQAANHLLHDRDALGGFYEEKGYLLLRGVLDPDSIAKARRKMMQVMTNFGLVEAGAEVPIWTGRAFPGNLEESAVFSGIAATVLEHPANRKLMAHILGEPASIVPVVQYRTYPPGTPPTPVHQEGFYSPGIINYRGFWFPLANVEREVGGLMLAVGQHRSGYFHNLAKPPRFPIPEGVIPSACWASTDYFPGDLVIFHEALPHGSLPNRSDRCRMTIDTRLQSASEDCLVWGAVSSATESSITLQLDDFSKRTFVVTEDTLIRIGDKATQGDRTSPADFAAAAHPGLRLVVVFEGQTARTIRRASEG